jgi:hypothetical protein
MQVVGALLRIADRYEALADERERSQEERERAGEEEAEGTFPKA